jgi:hypothetical protein
MHDILKSLLEFFGDILRDVATNWAISNYADKKNAKPSPR